jgi:hypothetical protein
MVLQPNRASNQLHNRATNQLHNRAMVPHNRATRLQLHNRATALHLAQAPAMVLHPVADHPVEMSRLNLFVKDFL